MGKANAAEQKRRIMILFFFVFLRNDIWYVWILARNFILSFSVVDRIISCCILKQIVQLHESCIEREREKNLIVLRNINYVGRMRDFDYIRLALALEYKY